MQENNKSKKEEGVNDIKVYNKTMIIKIVAKGEKWHR